MENELIVCQKCGEQNPLANNYCKKCTAPLKDNLPTIQPKKKGKGCLISAGVVVAVIVLIIIIAVASGGSTVKELNDANTKSFEQIMKTNGSYDYDYGNYELKTDGSDITLKITLEFKTDDIFRVGAVTAIRNLVIEHLQNKYKETSIELTVASEKPTNTANYTYSAGKWDKPVE